MTHRPIGSLAALGALLAALGVTAGASASATDTKTVSFRLSNPSGAPVSEMNFVPVPLGTIVPPVIGIGPDGVPVEGSPMTLRPGSTGIDPATAIVWLRVDPADPDRDRLDLLFGYEPDPDYDFEGDGMPFRPLFDAQGGRVGQLAPGGALDFELSLAPDVDPSLLQPATAGLSLSLLDVPSPGPDPAPGPAPGPGIDPDASVPEPSALLLWSAIGFGALALARRRRASRAQSDLA